MSGGRELALHLTAFEVAVHQCEASGLVVGRHHHECLAVACSPFEHGTYRTVEVVGLLHQHGQVVEVSVVVELRALDHKEESFGAFALRCLFRTLGFQQVKALERRLCQTVAAVGRQGSVHLVGEGKDGELLESAGLVPGVCQVIAPCFKFLHDVPSVRTVHHLFPSSAADVVHTALGIVGSHVELLVAVHLMTVEVGWCGIPNTACEGHARSHAAVLGKVYERGCRISVGIHPDAVVARHLAGGEEGAAGTAVGDEPVDA